jgi:ATP-binding cassette, subfamily C, bacterial LapB
MEKSVDNTDIFPAVTGVARTLDHGVSEINAVSETSFDDDPLLASLGYLARHFGKPFSKASVLSGLPLHHNQITADLFPRAAEKIGLKARILRRRISQVPALVLPVVILFDSGDVGVVVSKVGKDKVSVVFPAVSEDRQVLSIKSLQKDSNGFLFYITVNDTEGVAATGKSGAEKNKGHWLWSAVYKFWPSWTQVILAALIINLLALALPLFVMNVYDRVIPNLAIPTLWALAAGVSIAIVFDIILKQVRAVTLDMAGRRVDMQVAASLYEHALGISMDKRPGAAGVIANQIRDFESVRDFFTSSSIIAVTDLLFVGIFVLILWLIVGPLAFVPLAAIPVVLLITLFVQIPLARSVQRSQVQSSRRHSILIEGLICVEAIKSVGGESVMQRRWEDAVAATARANSSTKFWSTFTLNFTGMVQQVVSVVVIVWGVFLVGDGSITIGALIAANILSGRILSPLGNIAMTAARAQYSFAAMRSISEFMELESERDQSVASGLVIEKGEIEFRDVSYTYPQQAQPALSGISFKTSPGETIGIIGRVGSGKTTLGKLIARLYTQDQGSILVDGMDSRQYEIPEYREAIGYVSQEPDLIAGTLRDNIILGKPTASEAEIAEVVEMSGVKDFIANHPLGLNMLIGERGRGLSGGQRHAVSFARILLKQPQVLFLDEPSGALDTKTEAALISNLQRWSRSDRTLIVCTHRSSLLKLVDRIMVVEGGRLVIDGPRDAVLTALKNQASKNAKPPDSQVQKS